MKEGLNGDTFQASRGFKMRLVVISDTHGLHNRIEILPEGDVLVHAGDFMNSGYDPQDIWSFNCWLGRQPSENRIVIGGNPVPESTVEMKRRSELAAIAMKFCGTEMPSWDELDAFVDLVSPAMRSRLCWRLNKSLGLDANATCHLFEDKSIEDGVADDWLRCEKRSD